MQWWLSRDHPALYRSTPSPTPHNMTSIVLPNMPNTSLTPEVYTAAATRGPRRPVSRLKPIEAEIAYTWLAPVLRQWRGMKHSTDTPNPEQQQR